VQQILPVQTGEPLIVDNNEKGSELLNPTGRRIAVNAGLNVCAQVSPLLVGFFCVPVLLRTLGTDRLGVLMLVWAIIGYSSLFDLGLGRALTKLVSEQLGLKAYSTIPKLVGTSLTLMFVGGVIGALILISVAHWFLAYAPKVPAGLLPEIRASLYVLALSIPVLTISAGLKGLLEAYQRFQLLALIRIPIGVFTFASPLIILPFTKNLAAIVLLLLLGRILAAVVQWWASKRVVPEVFGALAAST
jgi:O-antigen/teichoic acid export membrane protein